MEINKDKIKEIKEKINQAADKTGEKIKDARLDEKLVNISQVVSNVASNTGKATLKLAKEAEAKVGQSIEHSKTERQKKKEYKFQSVDALQQVVNVVNEAAAALNDSTRTIRESAIPDVLAGALGAGVGGVGSFALLYGLGAVGLSAAGITSGLATAGAIVGGGMVAGIFVLAAPVAALAGIGVLTAEKLKSKQLCQEKERLYEEALRKHEAIILALKKEANSNKERLDYLQSLNILLQQAVKDLKSDIDLANSEV